jgi:hypothetical protein
MFLTINNQILHILKRLWTMKRVAIFTLNIREQITTYDYARGAIRTNSNSFNAKMNFTEYYFCCCGRYFIPKTRWIETGKKFVPYEVTRYLYPFVFKWESGGGGAGGASNGDTTRAQFQTETQVSRRQHYFSDQCKFLRNLHTDFSLFYSAIPGNVRYLK